MSPKQVHSNKLFNRAFTALITTYTLLSSAQAVPTTKNAEWQISQNVTQIASRKAAKNQIDSNEIESQLNTAAKSLRGSKEFLKAVESRDSRAISAMVLKQSGLDVPLSVKFKGDVNIENITIFIGCQDVNGVRNCGIWIYS
jgi:hypothetical protein